MMNRNFECLLVDWPLFVFCNNFCKQTQEEEQTFAETFNSKLLNSPFPRKKWQVLKHIFYRNKMKVLMDQIFYRSKYSAWVYKDIIIRRKPIFSFNFYTVSEKFLCLLYFLTYLNIFGKIYLRTLSSFGAFFNLNGKKSTINFAKSMSFTILNP